MIQSINRSFVGAIASSAYAANCYPGFYQGTCRFGFGYRIADNLKGIDG
jgi:hypothetical protein